VDACVDDARESRPCGLNDRGIARRSCVEGNWAAWDACDDPDVCVDGDEQVDAMPCGVEGNGTRSRACAEGAWGEWGACDDPDRVCGAGETETVPCGLNGRGERSHACEDGRWGAFGPCADPDACIDGNAQQRACGLNGNGEQSRSCVDGQWRAWSSCADPDVCVEDDEETRVCGRNRRGTSTRRCDGGQWSHWGDCQDPDVCVDGSVASRPCEGDGEQTRTCNRGAWSAWGACEAPGCDPNDARCLRCTDALEPNSGSREAAAIVHGETVIEDLTLCTDRDRSDWYGITVDEPSVVRAEVHWQGNVDVGFVGGYTATSGSAGGFGWGAPQAMGTYFVSPANVATYVHATVPNMPANATVDYRLEVTTDPFPVCVPGGSPNCVPCTDAVPNDSREQALELDLGDPVEDAVCGAWFEETTDAWKVQVPGPGTLVVTFEQQRRFAGGAVMWVRDAQGDILDDVRDGDERRVVVPFAQPVVALVESDRGASQYRLRFDFESHICGDGEDNDGDGLIDAEDPGCVSATDGDEADPQVAPECADGIDNDDDGAADYPNDPDCDYAGGPREEPVCALEDALRIVLAPDATRDVEVNTGVAGADYGARCGANGRGQERPLRLVAPAQLHLVAEITAADYDPVLHARRVCDDDRSALACDDDGGEGNLSRLELDLDAGSTFLFVDAFAEDGGGAATLRLTTTPR
jgi:hypothetical protein